MSNVLLDNKSSLEDIINLMGFDQESKNYTRWKKYVEIVESVKVKEHIEKNKSLFDKLDINVKLINEDGVYFLFKSTHYLKYVTTSLVAEIHLEDIRILLSIAIFISGHNITVQPIDAKSNVLILEGTNIVLSKKEDDSWPRLDFLASQKKINIDGENISLSSWSNKSKLIVEKFEFEYAASLLFDGDFITLFKEESPKGKGELNTQLVLEEKDLAGEWLMLEKVKSELQENWPPAWQVIKDNVLYINWSDVAASGTDIREYRGAIRLNPMFDLPEETERLAWVTSSLYHEAKHQQFQAIFESEYAPDDKEGISPLLVLGKIEPKIVCAWRGYPSPRSLPDHLFAMHAFISGLVINYEIMSRVEQLSDWTKDHVEMDMRGINGAISVIILGQRFFTKLGRSLSDVLRRDYAIHLVPTFSKMITWPKAENTH